MRCLPVPYVIGLILVGAFIGTQVLYLATPAAFRATVTTEVENVYINGWAAVPADVSADAKCSEPDLPHLEHLLQSWPKLKAFLARQPSCKDTAENKYIVHIATAGLGNRIQSIISSLVLAVVTERCLLVEWRNEELLPCAPDALWCPSSLMPHVWDASIRPSGEGASESLFLSFHGPSAEITDLITCTHPKWGLTESKFVFINTDEYYLPLLLYNDRIKADLPASAETDETHFYSTLVRMLFHPRQHVLTKMRSLVAQKPCALGVQIRVDGPRPMHVADAAPRVANCCRALLASEAAWKLTVSDSVWLATDRQEVLPEVLRTLKREVGAQVTILSRSFTRTECSAIEEAVAEAYMLSTCEHLILSEWSSFGYLISGLSGKRPWSLRNGACAQLASSLPCYNEMAHMRNIECLSAGTRDRLDAHPCCMSGHCQECVHHARWKLQAEGAQAGSRWLAIGCGVLLLGMAAYKTLLLVVGRFGRRRTVIKHL